MLLEKPKLVLNVRQSSVEAFSRTQPAISTKLFAELKPIIPDVEVAVAGLLKLVCDVHWH